MFPFPPLSVAELPLAAVPVLMAILCGIATTQQNDRPLRILCLSLLLRAISLLMLTMRLPEPAWSVSAALYLISAGLVWLAICDMMGRPRRAAWLLPAPAIWFAVHLGASIASNPAGQGWSLPDLLCFMALDDGLVLVCLPPLLSSPARNLPLSALVALLGLGPAFSVFLAVAAIEPSLPFAEGIATIAIPLQLARSILCPGLIILNMMDRIAQRERHLALEDDLSGLLNRRGFFRAAAGLSDRSLLLFDIDHFKRINDTNGHAAGDAAIRRFAVILGELFNGAAVLGRVGGEEFCAAIDGIGRDRALRIAERVRIAFADSERAIGTNITVSVGVALPPPSPLTVGDHLAAADRALYRAKTAGRNCVVLDPDPAAVRSDGLR